MTLTERVLRQQAGWFEDEGVCVRCMAVAHGCCLAIPEANFQAQDASRAAGSFSAKYPHNSMTTLFSRLSPLRNRSEGTLHVQVCGTVFILRSVYLKKKTTFIVLVLPAKYVLLFNGLVNCNTFFISECRK